MKKIVAIILALIMITCFVGCGGSKNVAPQQTSSTESEIDDELPGKVTYNSKEISYMVSAPVDYVDRTMTGYIVDNESYFIVYDNYIDEKICEDFGYKKSSFKNVTDVLPVMEKQVIGNIKRGLIDAESYTLNIDSSEKTTVNKQNMCKYKGTISLTSSSALEYNSASFVAYSALKNGYPLYFIIVNNPKIESDTNLEELAEKIAGTYREYKEDENSTL